MSTTPTLPAHQARALEELLELAVATESCGPAAYALQTVADVASGRGTAAEAREMLTGALLADSTGRGTGTTAAVLAALAGILRTSGGAR